MAEYIEQAIRLSRLDALDSIQELAVIKEKTGLRPSQLTLALGALSFIICVILQLESLIIGFACYMVPAYFSFLSMEAHNRQKSTKYLTYWVVFAVSEVLSPIVLWTLGGFLHAIVRVVLTVALLHPQIDLSSKIYYGFISPYLMQNEKKIDDKMKDLADQGQKKINDLADEGVKKIEELKERSKEQIDAMLKTQ